MRDVQRWLAEEPTVSCSSADLERIREAVAVLSHPKPRKEHVRPLQKKWQGAQQKNKKTRPLQEVFHEFEGKVIKAAQKLQQQLSDSAEQPVSSTAEQPVPMEAARRLQSASGSAEQPASSTVEQSARMDTTDGVASAEQPGASSAMPPAPGAARPDVTMGVPRNFNIYDFKIACRREGDWHREQAKLRRRADQPHKTRFQKAFALLQDCRKYNKSNWIVDDDEKHMKKLLRLLEILALPHLTRTACRELYNLSGRNSILGPFACRDAHGHQREQDHEHYRAVVFDATMLPALISFFSRREPLPATDYPYLASFLELLRTGSGSSYGHDVKVDWPHPRELREIWAGLPRTQDLWLLEDYAEHEEDYLWFARERDRAMGIPIESDDQLYARFVELYPHPPVCSNTGWCRDRHFNQACECDLSFLHDLDCACAACTAVASSEDPCIAMAHWTDIQSYKAANLAMGLGPSRPSPSIEGSAAQPADIAMS